MRQQFYFRVSLVGRTDQREFRHQRTTTRRFNSKPAIRRLRLFA
ncbi:hypothetical protein RB4166 [Rhodopirellula baltica SH 1]|uniref:Uncharacterized protein n=1 Tax=Rhodopirellula baltica (strain DSM 10527 / NCIMB 13988 / SH1) TaxID=243090 RepID=Q7UT20_RHOBA|nr:hypothetical protein RB4166 [Rhodopirellula baltica SH 1]